MTRRMLAAASLALLLAACGGGGGGSSPTTTATAYTVSANVTGLGTGDSVTLSDGTDSATLSANGSYSFKTALQAGASYQVKVTAQPAGQTCTVSNGSGTVGSSNVLNIGVTCAFNVATTSTGSSTGFSVLAAGTSRVAFLPVGSTVVPVDLSAPLAPAAPAGAVSARAASLAASSGLTAIPLPWNVDACAIDNSALKLVCTEVASTTSANLAVLDLSKFATSLNPADITVQSVTLSDIASQSSSSFSGDNCLACGVMTVPNPANPSAGQILVSSADGYHVYGYPSAGASTMIASHVYNVPIGENMAVALANGTTQPDNYLIAPDYRASSGTGTHVVNLIDLNKASVYSWTQPACSSITDTTQQSLCNSFQFESIDSAAIDPQTQVLVLQSESGNEVLELDLSQAKFTAGSSGAPGSFTAPAQYASMNNTGYGDMSGSLVSGLGDDLFTGAEFAAPTISVAQLPSSGGSGGAFPASPAMNPVYVDLSSLIAQMGASAPCGGSFGGADDPHNEAMTLSVAGTQYGVYGSSGNSCIALINLGALLAEPRDTTNPNQVASTVDLVGTKVVQFFSVP